MKRTRGRYAASVALAGFVAASAPAGAYAGDGARCASVDETDAFQLRDLQSRLMVAALSCNQQAAYNHFVETFKPLLASAGRRLQAYYRRTGGGEVALNRHMTALANAAGPSRAEKPDDFCSDAWTMFLLLQDQPVQLPTIAASHVMPGVEAPRRCEVPATVAGALKTASETP